MSLAAAHAALRQAVAALADAEDACEAHDESCECPACGLLHAGELAGYRWAIRQVACGLDSLVPRSVLHVAKIPAPAPIPSPILELEPVPQDWRPR